MHLNLEFYRFEPTNFKSALFYPYFCSSIFGLLYKNDRYKIYDDLDCSNTLSNLSHNEERQY